MMRLVVSVATGFCPSRLLRAGRILLSFAVLSVGMANAHAERETVDLSGPWKFIRQDAAPNASFDQWETVQVPHSWNALDGQDGKGYYRGPAWYAKTFDAPANWKDKRVFIRFGGAFLIADVWLNGHLLGEHRGGFAAFAYELTPYLKPGEANVLRVRLDNARNSDVPPLRADFTMQGGIYRPVSLLVTDPVCITPLDFGGPGLRLTPQAITAAKAVVKATVELDSSVPADATVGLAVTDAGGQTVARRELTTQIGKGKPQAVEGMLEIPKPRLWQGRKDPYLYTVTATVMRDGKPVDGVSQPLGLRTMTFDNRRGFLLNGQPYALHGVDRHQERKDKGWALDRADEDEDMGLIVDIGATCLRLAHYQQSEHFLDLADRAGLIVWEEIPVVEAITGGREFAENAKQQLAEMITQHANHPSIAVWGIFNELYNGIAEKNFTPPEPLMKELVALGGKLDPTRPIGAVTNQPKRPDLSKIPEVLGVNIYPGWYAGEPKDFGKNVRAHAANVPGRRIFVTEYGAGANPGQHEEGAVKHPAPRGQWHPEEWQAIVHEEAWRQAKNDPSLFGTFVWAMFDFASDGRNEGATPGINDKGLVSQDRKLKKDAYFFYRANWNPEPTLYIASRRMTERKEKTTEVKVYSNADEVELTLNGRSLGVKKPDDIRTCRWPGAALQPGKNQIVATARKNGKTLRDECDWTLSPSSP